MLWGGWNKWNIAFMYICLIAAILCHNKRPHD